MAEKINIPCNTENLKEVRKFVTSSLGRYALPDTELNMIVLAVDEICANRIIHSNKSDRTRMLEVAIEEEVDGILFYIKDQGEYYDNTKQLDPDIQNLLKERRKGGVGLMLVRRIMDSIEVKKEDNFTTYTLFKKLNITHA
jgi:serine/threonine-protein kinase RsbW